MWKQGPNPLGRTAIPGRTRAGYTLIMIRTRSVIQGAAGLMAVVLALTCPGQEAFAQALRISRPAPSAGALFLPPSAAVSPGPSLQPSALQFSAPALSAAFQAAPSIETPPQPSRLQTAASVIPVSAAPVAPKPKASAKSEKELKRQAS